MLERKGAVQQNSDVKYVDASPALLSLSLSFTVHPFTLYPFLTQVPEHARP